MSESKARQAANILTHARQNTIQIKNLPDGLQPASIEEAYAIQDEIAALSGPIAGWKASFEPDGGTPKVAPVTSAYVNVQSAGLDVAGPVRLEVEYAVKFGVDLPKKASLYRDEDIAAAIASAHVVFEVLGTRFEDRTLVSKLSYLADGNGNDAIVVGDEIADGKSIDLTKLDVKLMVNGELAGEASSGVSFAQVLGLLASLANHAAEHSGGLKSGQVVITGARVGPVVVKAGSIAEGIINGNAKVQLHIR